MDEKALKKRVLDKLLEMFTGLVWEINGMDYEELEQMDKDLDKGIAQNDYSRCHTEKS